jgi:hypothetical protein
LAQAGASLFPSIFKVTDLLTLLPRFAVGIDKSTVSGARYVVTKDWPRRCPKDKLPELMAGFLRLAQKPPLRRARGEPAFLSERYEWLIDGVISCATHLIEELGEGTPPPNLIEALLFVQHASHEHYRSFSGQDELKTAMQSSVTLRRAFVHALAANYDPNSLYPILHGRERLLSTEASDTDWLIGQAQAATDGPLKSALTRAATEAWISHGRLDESKPHLRACIDQLTDNTKEMFIRWLEPQPPSPEERKWRRTEEQQKAVEQQQLQLFRTRLENGIDDLRTGKGFANLFHLNQFMFNAPNGSNANWGQTNFEAIEAAFGPEISNAAKEGFRQIWRNWTPPLPSEVANRSQVENGVIVGLTGLALLETEDFNFSSLTDAEVRTATHYALRELNPFPTWFESLIRAKAAIITPIILDQIEAQVGDQTEDHGSIISLAGLKHLPLAGEGLGTHLVKMLRKFNPITRRLAEVLELIHLDNTFDQLALLSVAKSKTARLWKKDADSAAIWLHEWLKLEPIGAWTFLEKNVSSGALPPREIIKRLMLALRDDADRGSRARYGYSQTPAILTKLIPLLYKYFPIDQDPRHVGVYNVTSEDDAVEARGTVARLLELIEGPEAHKALHEMANHPGLIALRGSYLSAIERHAERAIEFPAWTPSEVSGFAVQYERDPANAEELFQLACDRIFDIKADIERGDFGDKGAFPGASEEVLQRYFAGRLDRERRGRYSVVRESEVAGYRKPDIRLWHPKAGVVSVEIKPIDRSRYTAEQLKSALKDQLVGLYMKATGSKHGILLLCMVAPRTWRQPKKLDLAGMGNFLNAEAAKILRKKPHLGGLKVIAIDASPIKARWSKRD